MPFYFLFFFTADLVRSEGEVTWSSYFLHPGGDLVSWFEFAGPCFHCSAQHSRPPAIGSGSTGQAEKHVGTKGHHAERFLLAVANVLSDLNPSTFPDRETEAQGREPTGRWSQSEWFAGE